VLAGIPAVYTRVAHPERRAAWQYYLYLLLYVFVFMLDDLIVFFTVMKTLEVTGLSTRYARISRLLGGIVLVILGALLLLRPSADVRLIIYRVDKRYAGARQGEIK